MTLQNKIVVCFGKEAKNAFRHTTYGLDRFDLDCFDRGGYDRQCYYRDGFNKEGLNRNRVFDDTEKS